MPEFLKPDQKYLCHCGVETDLIFNRGVDLPEFSLYPLLDRDDGREIIAGYADELIALAQSHGLGTILETATWMANADRAQPLGYGPEDLDRVNRAGVALMRDCAARAGGDVLVSANIGPRADGYAAGSGATVEEAQRYHAVQIQTVAEAGVDLISGYTLGSVAEAAGIAKAAAETGVPCVISFTVETDGHLADGTALTEAMAETDRLSGGAVSYYMINCAHPDHFDARLGEAAATGRLKGLVVNASRCSHEELDNAEALDAGDPPELAALVAAQAERHGDLQVFGGCCGTDQRHLARMAESLGKAAAPV